MAEQGNDAHGRGAQGPSAIPPQGWLDILIRVKAKIGEHSLSVIAAGVAFHSLFALFPAMAAAMAIYGLVADPELVQSQVAALGAVLPEGAREIILGQLQDLAGSSQGGLTLSLILSILLALWGATRAVRAMIMALNVVYEEKQDTRGFFAQNILALGLTAGGLVLLILALVLIAAVPIALSIFDPPGWIAGLANYARWPLLALFALFALTMMYRIGPARRRAKWRWVTWGSAVATLLWLVASWGFSIYVANFGNYNETYGSLGAVIVLLMWFFISAFVVLIGAQLDAAIEHQTRVDSTIGPDKPMGQRGAVMADTLGPTRQDMKKDEG